MLDLVALVVAIFLLLQLQRARVLLSLVFSPLRAVRCSVDEVPAAIADLHEAAAAELAALGFEGPYWYRVDSADDTSATQPVAAWRRAASADALWLYPPQDAAQPNRLVAVFVRRLADGRHALSQAFDSFAEITANAQLPAQTIGGADLAAQWQLHDRWCESLGATAADGVDDVALDWQAAELHNQRLAALAARGLLYRDSGGLWRPRLGYAWQLARSIARRPRPPADTVPVPPARLAWLAGVVERQSLRPVPRRVQAGLFGFSVALFLAAGAWLWSLGLAAILFVVVALHELGHYLAMRLFGYRNVQMLALPLVGGVTIGHEVNPDAARRAWMSLMGPLPGILIGWALLVWVLAGGSGQGVLFEAALVFLFVNYLNVLPLPPLDGAHVVQALLPVGAARLSAVFIAVASLAGAVLAFAFGFTLLAILALLQLPGVRTRWQLGGVLRALRSDPAMAAAQPDALRQQRVYETYERIAGATPFAARRIALGTEALRSLDLKPMRRLQRGLIGAIYLLLLAGPLAAAALALVQWRAESRAVSGFEADAARLGAERQQAAARASALDLAGLLQGFPTVAPDPPPQRAAPADTAAFAAAQQRLGLTLPADLAGFYRLADGVAGLDGVALLPLNQVQPLSDAAELEPFVYDGSIPLGRGDGEALQLAPQALSGLLLIGRDAHTDGLVLYDAAESPRQAGLRLYALGQDESQVEAGLQDWLRERWIYATLRAERWQRYERAQQRELAELAGLAPAQLLLQLERPPWWQRLLPRGRAWPRAADAQQIEAAAARFGAPLPPDLAEAYAQHDGMPVLQLLPLAQWQAVAALDPAVAQALRLRQAIGGAAVDIDRCIAIAGHHDGGLRTVSLLWCPQAPAPQRYVDLQRQRGWPDFSVLLRTHVAQQRAARGYGRD